MVKSSNSWMIMNQGAATPRTSRTISGRYEFDKHALHFMKLRVAEISRRAYEEWKSSRGAPSS